METMAFFYFSPVYRLFLMLYKSRASGLHKPFSHKNFPITEHEVSISIDFLVGKVNDNAISTDFLICNFKRIRTGSHYRPHNRGRNISIAFITSFCLPYQSGKPLHCRRIIVRKEQAFSFV